MSYLADTPTDLSLPAQLVVLSYYAGQGKAAGQRINAGVAGGELAEFLLAGRIRTAQVRRFGLRRTLVETTDPTPVGDPLLDDVLHQIAMRERQRSAKDWIVRRPGALEQHRDWLLDAGVLELEREEARLLPRTVKRYRPRPADRAPALRAEVRSTLLHRAPMRPRSMALASLAHVSGLTKLLVEKHQRKAALAAAKDLPKAFKQLQPVLKQTGDASAEDGFWEGLGDFCDGLGDLITATADAGSGGDGGGGDGGSN